jgi:hypothetical protein
MELDTTPLSIIAGSEKPAYEWWRVATVTAKPFVNLKTIETPSYSNSSGVSGTNGNMHK